MIKSELIQKISTANPHLYNRDIEKIVNVLFDEIVSAMARGDRVELRGFGAFTVKHRDARTGRNPRTGATVSVEEKFVPFFKTGKELRERLNGKAPASGRGGRKASVNGKGTKVAAPAQAQAPKRDAIPPTSTATVTARADTAKADDKKVAVHQERAKP